MTPVLELDGVSKRYPVWRAPASGRSIMAVLESRTPLRHRRADHRWAVHDISLTLQAGESVGLIGGNGAGKSSLLRVASGLVRPTRGSVRAVPGMASVLTLGESFALELTGAENALTLAVVSGFSTAHARSLVPEILAFAELEDAADAPVRTYSEGMKLRLAFGVVAQLEPPVLLLDEVMAVGDLRFQDKSGAHVRRLRERGTAILVASHDLDRLADGCDRVLWLQHGEVREAGPAAAVITSYRRAMLDESIRRTPAALIGHEGDEPERLGSQEASVREVRLAGPRSAGVDIAIDAGSWLEVVLAVAAPERLPTRARLVVGIFDADDVCVCSLDADGAASDLGPEPFDHELTLRVDRLDLAPGTYTVEVGLYRIDWEYAFDLRYAVCRFDVGGGERRGLLLPPYTWRLSDGSPRGDAGSAPDPGRP